LVDVSGGKASEQVDASDISELDGLHHNANLERGHCGRGKVDESKTGLRGNLLYRRSGSVMAGAAAEGRQDCVAVFYTAGLAGAAAEVAIEHYSFMLRDHENNIISPADNTT